MMKSSTFSLRFWQSAALGAIALLLSPEVARAHGANVQARNAEAVEIYATYDSGEPMVEAQVQIFAPDDPQHPYVQGKTDAAGRYVFVPTQPGNWEVSVRQAGHGDIAVVPVAPGGVLSADFSPSGSFSLIQRLIMIAAVAWGSVGTALYFARGKR